MQGSNFVPRYFLESDLLPTYDYTPQDVLSSTEFQEVISKLINQLENNSQIQININDLSSDEKIIIDIFRSIGCFKIYKNDNIITIKDYTNFSINLIKSFSEYILNGISVIQNWRTRIPLDNEVSGLETLIYLENRRIEESKQHGLTPKVFCNIPAAAAIIKAKTKKNQDIYLFELNKDWHKLNFIGGKQEQSDNGSHLKTILREINEELGLDKRFVKAVQLSDPIVSFGLSGNSGCLSRYPAVLYQAFFNKMFGKTSVTLKWVTYEEFKDGKTHDGYEFMITPYYRDFIFNKMDGGLEGLPYSYSQPIDFKPAHKSRVSLKEWITENKDLFAAILTITAAIIGLILYLLGVFSTHK